MILSSDAFQFNLQVLITYRIPSAYYSLECTNRGGRSNRESKVCAVEQDSGRGAKGCRSGGWGLKKGTGVEGMGRFESYHIQTIYLRRYLCTLE